MSGVDVLHVGGGAAGIIGAAYASAVVKSGISVDRIHGCSVGAINAALHSQMRMITLKEAWMRIRNRDVYYNNPLTWLNAFGKKASIYDPSPLRKLIQSTLQASSDTLIYPTYVSITDVKAQRGLSINLNTVKGDWTNWVFASASPPVFFPPVDIEKKRYTDGGIVDLSSIHMAVRRGAKVLVVLNPRGPKDGHIGNIVEAMKFTIGTAIIQALFKDLDQVAFSHPEVKVVLIQPETSEDQPQILDFDALGSRTDRESLWNKYESQALRVLSQAF